MNSRRFYILSVIWCVLAGACLPHRAAAQSDEPADTVQSLPGVEIETSVDRAEMYVGDIITYTVAITHDTAVELIPPPLGANLGAFDVKDFKPDMRTDLGDGRVRDETQFQLSTFTTGEYAIPPLPVTFRLPDGTSRIMVAESVPVTVKSLLGDKEADTLDIKPLKAQVSHEVFEEGLQPRDYGLIALGVLAVAGLILWYMMRRRRRTEPDIIKPPWEIAFANLALLQDRRLVEKGQAREFYFELSEIARSYLERVYSLDVMEMTTSEFVAAFRDGELPDDWYDRLTGLFTYADLVKFAKHEPEPDRPAADFDQVHDLVETVRVDTERKRELEEQRTAGMDAQPTREEQAA